MYLPTSFCLLALLCGPLNPIQANDVPACYSIDEGGKQQFTFRLVSCYKNKEQITHRFKSKDDISIEKFVRVVFMEETNDNKYATTKAITTTDDINPSSFWSGVYTTQVTEASDSTWSYTSFVMSTEGFSSEGFQSTELDQTTTVSPTTTRRQERSTDASTSRQFSTPIPSTEVTTDLSTSKSITTKRVTQLDQTTTVSPTTTRRQEHSTDASTSRQFSTPIPSSEVTTDLSTSKSITTKSVTQLDQTTTVSPTTTRRQEHSTDASTSRQFSTLIPSTEVTTDLSTSESITTKSVTPCLTWADNIEFSFCVSSVALSWYDAVENCRHNNGRLVHINSDEKQKTIVNFREAEGSNFSWLWIGVNDIDTEGVWKLEDDATLDVMPFWGDGEPNGNTGDKTDQDCVFAIKEGEWRDYPCMEELHFICERKIIVRGDLNTVNTDFLRDG